MSRTTNNTNNIKSSRKFSLLLTVTALFLVLSITIAAWFATVNSTEIGFNTGDVQSEMKLWVATVDTYTSSGTSVRPDESSRKFSTTYENYYPIAGTTLRNDKEIVDNVNAEKAGTLTTTTLENYTFGLIDNLLDIRPDNITYLKIEVPESINTIRFNIHYDEDAYNARNHVILFKESAATDKKWEEVVDNPEDDPNATPVTDFLNIESNPDGTTDSSKHLCYLQFSYATSSQDLEANAIAGADLSFGEWYYFNDFELKTATFKDDDINQDNKCRYLYIKITPNFAAIGLSGIMNSLAYFDVEAEFEAFRMDSTTETQETTNP